VFWEFDHASAIDKRSDEKILEPVVVIGKVIEVSKVKGEQVKTQSPWIFWQ
jgi:hypothetical protein